MRKTLRRSCDACAKSKLSCDLLTPRCSRCIKRKVTTCVYANEPLSTALAERPATAYSDVFPGPENVSRKFSSDNAMTLYIPRTPCFDPFDSYPTTRLSRTRVQQLIQHFLSNIAFQYYPLDLQMSTNPFVVSWWPLALQDPALFHVSLQTASLDIELRAQNGFSNSDILMAVSVSLVRQRVEAPLLASRDETIDSVVTLAAIEFGKGNTAVGNMHINGVKRMVQMRGGIHQLKLTSPLTARMVAWVSLILMQSPQFDAQNDLMVGDGISPIPQWPVTMATQDQLPSYLSDLNLDPRVSDIFFRLRNLFRASQPDSLPSTDLHDLTCFVLHKLLAWCPQPTETDCSGILATSQCVRYAAALYMLIIHGPTYFSHAHLQSNMVLQLRTYLEDIMTSISVYHGPLAIWILLIGMVASENTSDWHWYAIRITVLAEQLHVCAWEDVLPCLEGVLWFREPRTEQIFKHRWAEAWTLSAP
ncbi:hypothetical protein BDW02DRAFT_584146 [Decorospora gaudefroyi]|uniref:Zn(2)-C6 fungal-type domain-containing protein n=1 Tax=Decorospora gaudefroyi TaxID=184978 RepID=A0A6A5JXG3_9PLEO|nr:hypothetical protein BDW02DRAFT_584146 [Decorospora gaudefroyi]